LESRLVGMGDNPLKDDFNGVHYRHVYLTKRVQLMMPNSVAGSGCFCNLVRDFVGDEAECDVE
jgi:hypothetical protein